MTGMDIATGMPQEATASTTSDPGSGLAPSTPVFAAETGRDGPQGGVVTDTSGVDFTAAVTAVQSSGHAADVDRRTGYDREIQPQGATYGDQLVMPVLPDNAVPPTDTDLYPYQGDEPTPAG